MSLESALIRLDMDAEIDAEEHLQETPVLSLEQIATLRAAHLKQLAVDIEAQRERIYAEFECHKSTILADFELDEMRMTVDHKNGLRHELHGIDEAHHNRMQSMEDFYRAQRLQIEKTASQLLAVAKTQKCQRAVENSNQNCPDFANFNAALPFSIAPLPCAPEDQNPLYY